MTEPITGPFVTTRVIDIDRAGSLNSYKEKWRQQRPYNKPMRYFVEEAYTVESLSFDGAPFGGMANANTAKSPPGYYAHRVLNPDPDIPHYIADALNQARSRFFGKISESAELAAALGERKQSLNMISNRARQLAEVFRLARRPSNWYRAYDDVCSYLKVRKRRPRKALTDFSDVVLETQFGWAPLVGDISGAIQVLDSPVNPGPTLGRCTLNFDFDRTYGSSEYEVSSSHKGKVRALVGGVVGIDDPNLYLWNRLGFANPAAVIWESVPFSFVVDYFINVGDYLQQFTETAGVMIRDPFNTVTVHDNCIRKYRVYPTSWDPPELRSVITSRSFSCTRDLGLPPVVLHVRTPWRLSTNRAVTSVALLLQRLRK